MKGRRDEYLAAARVVHGEEASLRRRGRTVVHRGVRDIHSHQPGDHRLELVDALESPLAYLRLIRGVRGVELPPAGDPAHGGRDEVVVRSGAEERRGMVHIAVSLREVQHQPQHFRLGQRGAEIERRIAVGFGNGSDQLIKIRDADRGEHLGALLVRVGDVRHRASCFLPVIIPSTVRGGRCHTELERADRVMPA